jgi:hypothetical protein
MTETMEPESNEVDPRMRGAVIAASEVDAWFVREILPLEAALMQFLQHNWRNKSDIADLRQDIYIQVYESALKGLPESSRAFLFTVARHLLIRRMPGGASMGSALRCRGTHPRPFWATRIKANLPSIGG